MFTLIGFGITIAAVIAGYITARRFVGGRLRFVDAAQRRIAPWIAGVVAGVIAVPVVALLPLVGLGTALVFGVAVGAGVASGAADVRRGTGSSIISTH